MSRFDQIYRKLLLTKFFVKGWGKPDNLKRILEFRKVLSDREQCQHLISPDYPVNIDKDVITNDCRIIEGHFVSPLTEYLPGVMPKEVETARFQVILPKEWTQKLKPVCVHMAGTGDHYFWRRRMFLAKPLLKTAGIASVILESPYYGVRKPKYQLRSSLHYVSDLFVMGSALVLESLVLFHWCQRQGWGPLGITGISMGGNMASLAATTWHKPLALIPCLSWSTASCVFVQGVMSDAIPWDVLQTQYFEDKAYREEIRRLLHSPEDYHQTAHNVGHPFAEEALSPIISERRVLRTDSSTNHNNHERTSTDITDQLLGNCQSDDNKLIRNNPEPSGNYGKSNTNVEIYNNPSDRKMSAYASAKAKLAKPSNISGEISTQSTACLQQESRDFMRYVMDECTHLGNYSMPIDPSLAVIIAAKQDAYVPRDKVLSLAQLWPGSDIRYIDAGHVSSCLFKQGVFKQAIIDAFDKQVRKYYS